MYRRLGKTARALAVGFICVICIGCIAVPVTGVKRDRDVVYTPESWPEKLVADVYRQQGDRLAPAVLLVHGGGMRAGGARLQMNGIAAKLAKRGYVVMNVTYRSIPNYQYPAPVDDLRQALKWMRMHAAEYRIDKRRIATFGYSAGGYLATLVALQYPPGKEQVRAIVAGGSPFDLTFYSGGNLIPTYLGGTLDDIPEIYDEASPVNYVNRHMPPIFIYHGSTDRMVRPEHALLMEQTCRREGASYELHWLHGHGHVGAFLFSGQVVDKAIDFLDREMK